MSGYGRAVRYSQSAAGEQQNLDRPQLAARLLAAFFPSRPLASVATVEAAASSLSLPRIRGSIDLMDSSYGNEAAFGSEHSSQ
jgi:hypothetical protein